MTEDYSQMQHQLGGLEAGQRATEQRLENFRQDVMTMTSKFEGYIVKFDEKTERISREFDSGIRQVLEKLDGKADQTSLEKLRDEFERYRKSNDQELQEIKTRGIVFDTQTKIWGSIIFVLINVAIWFIQNIASKALHFG